MEPIESKICSTCNIKKTSDEYYKNKSRPTGLQSQCKTCVNIKKRIHYQNNKEMYKKAYKNFIERNPNYFKDRKNLLF